MQRVYLSYLINPDTPAFPGEPTLHVKQTTEINDTSVYNSFVCSVPNHCGTHYDGPWHFNPNGAKITDLPIEYFWFDKVVVIDAPKKDGDCGVFPKDLEPYKDKIADAELLIIKTGYTKVRAEDTKKYQYNGPYLTPEVAQYLIDNFPKLRTVGGDFISIGTPANDLAAKTHQILHGCHSKKFITDIEDMDLSVLYEKDVKVNKVVTAPLRIEGLDSSQVTIMAEIEVA
ncbi:cyclase [Anaeromyces robustus]|uniref:Cyclase n=1 Tax=Anaeromyces robustus TaxID=1754192 RepID=A0A1Y1XD54_9FUNG|nr:cyclase [Anaeromyces robustus]|eukprot:ORX83721.1 cyclase [Anaeromyces robustus]